MTQIELNEVIRLHELRLQGDAAGKCACLAGENLAGKKLSLSNLSRRGRKLLELRGDFL